MNWLTRTWLTKLEPTGMRADATSLVKPSKSTTSRGAAKATIVKFQEPLPVIHGCAEFAQMLTQPTTQQEGVRQVVFSNGHLEPEHVKVLRGVAGDHAERGEGRAQVLFPDNTRRRWAETLGDEFKSGDCHAGRYETSIVLAEDPESVRAPSALEPVKIDLIEKMRAGVKSFREAGATDAYCGDPAAATAEEGEDLVARLADMIVQSVRETWPDLFR